MANHRISIKNRLLQSIVNGSKQLEIRPESQRHCLIQVGSTITFFSSEKEIRCRVSEVNRYKNLDEAVTEEKAQLLGPGYKRHQVINAIQGFYPRWNGAYLVFQITVVDN